MIDLKDINLDSISSLTDEELNHFLSVACDGLVDAEGRHLVFPSEDEALVYSRQLQVNHPEIRFVKIIPVFSMYVGKFFIIEPCVTEYSTKNFKTDADYNTGNDFAYVDQTIMIGIVESAKREKMKEAKKTETPKLEIVK